MVQPIPSPPRFQPVRKLLGEDFFADVVSLILTDQQVAEPTLADFAVLTRLKWLELDGDNVTDAALSHLEGLTDLQQLYLYGTKVTDKGIEKLHRALPELPDFSITAASGTDLFPPRPRRAVLPFYQNHPRLPAGEEKGKWGKGR